MQTRVDIHVSNKFDIPQCAQMFIYGHYTLDKIIHATFIMKYAYVNSESLHQNNALGILCDGMQTITFLLRCRWHNQKVGISFSKPFIKVKWICSHFLFLPKRHYWSLISYEVWFPAHKYWIFFHYKYVKTLYNKIESCSELSRTSQ